VKSDWPTKIRLLFCYDPVVYGFENLLTFSRTWTRLDVVTRHGCCCWHALPWQPVTCQHSTRSSHLIESQSTLRASESAFRPTTKEDPNRKQPTASFRRNASVRLLRVYISSGRAV